MSTNAKLPPWDFRRNIASVRVLVGLGNDKGVRTEDMLYLTGITPAMLADAESEVEATQEIQVIRNLQRLLGQPAGLGLEAGMRYSLQVYGLWGYAVVSSHTLGDAVHMTRRMLNQTFALTRNIIAQEGEHIVVTHLDDHLPADVREFIVERDRAAIVALQREVLGQPLGYASVQVKFPEPSPEMVRLYEHWYGATPQFSCHQHRGSFPAAIMTVPLPRANPQTARVCEDLCRGLVERQFPRNGFAGEIRDRLLRTPGHIPDMETISAELHITSRTLRRHLTAEGATFRALLEEVRSTLATELMLKARLSHAEIAERLGYADVTTFIEAFRRWKGMPPSAFRRAQGLKPGSIRSGRPLADTPPVRQNEAVLAA